MNNVEMDWLEILNVREEPIVPVSVINNTPPSSSLGILITDTQLQALLKVYRP